MLIDTHSHIDMDDFGDKSEIINNAKAVGVEKIVVPGVEPATFENIVKLTEEYDNVYGAIGVHPSEALKYKEETDSVIEDLLQKKKIVAVGEVGLDYYWDKSFVDEQKDVLIRQIKIAQKVNKPLIIHDREAHRDCFDILKNSKAADVGVLMHCFSGSVEFAQECINAGFYIALGGVVTFKSAKKMKEVAKSIPLERLMLETDAPYLTPVPHRGERNEPAYVKYTAEAIAELRGISFDELAEVTTKNAMTFFRLD